MAHGDFCWFDLMTEDTAAAESFFSAVVGWKTTTWDGGEKPYTMWLADDGPESAIGGLMKLPDEAKAMGAPPFWVGYVQVDDMAAACAKLTDLGGAVLQPSTEIPTMGCFSIVADPWDGVFALYQSTASGGPDAITEWPLRHISWHELMTVDVDKGWAFYEAMFGWKKTESMDMGPKGTYQMYTTPRLQAAGISAGGMMATVQEHGGPPAWLFYAKVADLDASLTTVKAQGGQVLNGPMEVPGGDRVAQCLDPQGVAFALHASPA